MADREAILLGSIGESNGAPVETAITGEDNSLVILMRDLLGNRLDRLDRLDRQSADFLDHLPL
ncbi:hypothetical protein DWB78_08610 [Halopelagius longus]|uniref:Uncharacterized protein n=1 Tax=Halopelagius longus TaxID=1236180 RepID=A0A370IMC4_9EURY|nr:hypothetical protein DWB78_08610 [Halopelagius longus]